MRILQIVTTYQSVVTILATKLGLLNNMPGVELHTASSREDPGERRGCSGAFHEVDIPRTIRPLRDIAAIIDLYKYIKKSKIDIVHTHTTKAGVVGAVAGRLARVPVVHTYHGLPFYEGQSRKAYMLYKTIESFCNRFRTIIFSQNKRDFETLQSIKSLKDKIQFEGNGVGIKDIEESARANIDKVYSFPDSTRLHLLCVARLEPVKRLETVIAAVKFLKDSGCAIDCIIAGKGELQNALQTRIGQAGLSQELTIVYTPYIHSLIAKSDIVILTSEKEGIPRGIMEAMALGKPVVATRVPGTDELVIHGETGFLAPLSDPAAFNNHLMQLVRDKNLRTTMGAAGRERIRKEFDEKRIVDLWMEWYGKLKS